MLLLVLHVATNLPPLGVGKREMADDERAPLLESNRYEGREHGSAPGVSDRRLNKLVRQDDEAASIVKSHVSVSEQKLADSAVGERLPYNDYTTIDWLHDLVSLPLSTVQKNVKKELLRRSIGQRLISSPIHSRPTRYSLQVSKPSR